MIFAASQLDPTVQGVLFLVAVVLFVVAAILSRLETPLCLLNLGLACATFVFAYNAFAAS